MKKLKVSESALGRVSQVSRLTIRALCRQHEGARLSSWAEAAHGLEYEAILLSQSERTLCDYSAQSVAYRVLMDGEHSWKIHYMNFVDEFRRTLDTRLIVLPPPSELSVKLQALLASIVCFLCHEASITAPKWAAKNYYLLEPWFVAESEALKPMTIAETPLEFKKNLIFVGNNFLNRV